MSDLIIVVAKSDLKAKRVRINYETSVINSHAGLYAVTISVRRRRTG
jgi:hypothetical protein